MASGESAIPRGTENAARAESFSTALRLLDEVMSINDQIAKDQKLRTIASYDDSVRVQQKMLFAASLALVVAISLGLLLGRGITRPIAAITRSRGRILQKLRLSSNVDLAHYARDNGLLENRPLP